MATHGKLSFILILCFFGHVMYLCSGFVVPSEDCSKNTYTKAELDDSCKGKNKVGNESSICKEYCKTTPTIDLSYFPSPVNKVGKYFLNDIKVACDGYCSQENTCLCVPVGDILYEEPGKIQIIINPEQTVFFSSVNLGGKNVSLGEVLCGDPK
ncbi:unnamed protein product [Adineta steineri]|uniref:Uncharacterized protein n=1 Tax=Adineta steineri TaxID=433720 RepID=A0A813VJL2_9BILA|nr:unnamed protein product [Adineta steineri]CAF1123444.1 unnamed protein product [Adineta steineri]